VVSLSFSVEGPTSRGKDLFGRKEESLGKNIHGPKKFGRVFKEVFLSHEGYLGRSVGGIMGEKKGGNPTLWKKFCGGGQAPERPVGARRALEE